MTKAVAFILFSQTGTRFRADELLSGSFLGRRTDRHFVSALTRVEGHSRAPARALAMHAQNGRLVHGTTATDQQNKIKCGE